MKKYSADNKKHPEAHELPSNNQVGVIEDQMKLIEESTLKKNNVQRSIKPDVEESDALTKTIFEVLNQFENKIIARS